MATRKPLVVGTGGAQEIATGDTLPIGVLPVGTTAGTLAAGDDARIVGALSAASNLSDLTNATTARTNLGLGTAATFNTGGLIGNIPALINWGGSGLPGLVFPGSVVIGRGSDAAADACDVYIQRVASYTGPAAVAAGTTPVGVNAALKISTDAHAGTLQYENGLLAILNNYGTAGDNSENCAIVGQSIKYSTGATWVADFELIDLSGPDPVAGSIAIEVDVRANGTDLNHNRVGVGLIVSRPTSGGDYAVVARGFEIGNSGEGANGSGVIHAFSVGLDPGVNQSAQYLPVAYVLDSLYATPLAGYNTVTTVRMAPGHQIEFNGSSTTGTTGATSRTLWYNALGALTYSVNGSAVVEVFDTGIVSCNGLYLDGPAGGLSRWWYDGSTGLLRYSYNGNDVLSVSQSGSLTATGGLGAFGHTPPGSQPARCVTLADVIAVLAGCGLTA